MNRLTDSYAIGLAAEVARLRAWMEYAETLLDDHLTGLASDGDELADLALVHALAGHPAPAPLPTDVEARHRLYANPVDRVGMPG